MPRSGVPTLTTPMTELNKDEHKELVEMLRLVLVGYLYEFGHGLEWEVKSELCKWDFKYYMECEGTRVDTQSFELDRIMRDGFNETQTLKSLRLSAEFAIISYKRKKGKK